MQCPNPHRRRRGFTLLEILVVIGIIMVLMALAVLGYNVVERATARSQTKTVLDDLHGMLAELDSAAGSGALPNPTYQNAMMQGEPALYGAIYGYNQESAGNDPDAGTGDTTPDMQIWLIGDVTTSGGDRGYTEGVGFNNHVMQLTQSAMGKLMTMPNNQSALSQLPSKLIMKDPNTGAALSPPILLDGWGNPIIYVPPAGICVYTTVGGTPTVILIRSHDGRPFFASAGPDGNFGGTSGATQANGDDNVYTIEK